jgi:hypothetical protein
MQTLRKYLCWLFALNSLVFLVMAYFSVQRAIRLHFLFQHPSYVGLPAVFLLVAFTYGMTWWTFIKGKASGRGWGLAASLINILFFVLSFFLSVFHRHFAWGHALVVSVSHLWLILGVGIAGVIAFWRRYEQPDPAAKAKENVPIPGDGTSKLINKVAGILIYVFSIGAYIWWLHWYRTKGFTSRHDGLLEIILIGLIIATVHEFGHTVTGLALGMRLRAFVAGPFQWQIRSGKWEFKFNLAALLSGGGATGVVPATADLPRWRSVCMIAAGPLINLVTGAAALWAAFAVDVEAPVQAGGMLALFGAFSLTAFAGNLIPFATKASYSDGAQIYQILAGGPWGDFHHAMAVVGSSLVTPLRPRDYDIQAIQRAAGSIAQGPRGLLLRLFAYSYFLDNGRIREAGEALQEAEAVYHQSASDIPAELHTDFVFGSACVRRDAPAARQWWDRMEAKKPTRFNADYWRANSALHWIEGSLKEANEAWEKSNTLTQQLPEAGAYEFDRYCGSLLREALDKSAAAS